MEYTKEYFIEKFSRIDSHLIGVGNIERNHCALWHCGVRINIENSYKITDEALSLVKLFGGEIDIDNNYIEYSRVFQINDGGFDVNKKYGSTPKERILNKLKSL